LKPDNVLLTSDGVPKITDFGLAKSLGEDRGQTASGAILGTPSYMAPEQAGGRTREITKAVDVYALGAILYEMLTSRPPFRAETPLDTLLLLVTEEATPPSELTPAVPRELEAICLKCLQKNPTNRYSDAEALADDLQRFLDGEPVSVCQEAMEQRARRWLRKRPLISTMVILTVCLALFPALALTYIEPSLLLISGWAICIATAVLLVLKLPDRRGLALLGFCSVLFAHVGWEVTAAAPPWENVPWRWANIPWLLSASWIYAATILFLLVPARAGSLFAAGCCSLVFGALFIGRAWLWRFEYLLHPIGVAACCIVGRSVARAIAGDRPTAVFAAVSGGILGYWFSYSWLAYAIRQAYYPYPGGKVVAGSSAIALLVSAAGAFLVAQFTSPPIRQWWSREIRRAVRPLAAVRLRVWLGVTVAPVAACLLLLVGRGLWLRATSRELLSLDDLRGNEIFSVSFSPDGRRLAAIAPEPFGWGHTLVIWDVPTGKRLSSKTSSYTAPRTTLQSYVVSFSPDGNRLAVADYERDEKTEVATPLIVLLDAAANQEILRIKGLLPPTRGIPVMNIRAFSFSPDGKRLAAGSIRGTTKVWDAGAREEVLTLPGQDGWINSVTFSPDRTRLVTCTNGEAVKIWDATTGEKIKTLREGRGGGNLLCAVNAAFSPDGRRVAAGSIRGPAKVWDAERGLELFSLEGGRGGVPAVAFSPNGMWVASGGGFDCTVRVWDAATGRQWLALKGHTDHVSTVAFSPDSRRLASAGRDKTVKIWRIAD
jgi:hypothetical protein